MNVLWLVRYPPAPHLNRGEAEYSRNLMVHLARLHRVDAITFRTPGLDCGTLPDIGWHEVGPARSGRLMSLASQQPSVAHRHDVPEFRRAVLGRGAAVDAIVVDHIGLFFIVRPLRRALGARRPPIIVVNHDHEASLRADMVRGAQRVSTRAMLYWDGVKARRLEREANRASDGLTAITTTDQAAFAGDAPGVPSLLLMPGYQGPVVAERRIDASVPERVCIIGGRGAFHKKAVLRMILERICPAGLQNRVMVDVVGSEGSAAEQKRYPGIRFLGYVDDLAGYTQGVRLGLIPDDIGGGFKLRALTHAFLRVPMLALDKAMAGMTFEPGTDFLAAASLDQLVGTIPSAVADLDRLNRVQDSAFARCAGRFDWSDRAASLANFITTLRTRAGSGPA